MSGIKQNSWIPILGIILIGAYILLSQIRFGFQSSKQDKTQINNNLQTQSLNKKNILKNSESTTLLKEEGLFQILIPEAFSSLPYKVLQEIPDPESGQSLSMPYYRYQSADNISTYEIGYIRLPEDRFQSKSHEQILNDLTQGELSRMQGLLRKEITTNQSFQLSNREIHIESVTNGLYAREILTINRPYIYIICFTSKNKNNLFSSQTEKYFSSFNLFKQDNIMPKAIIINSEH